MSEPENIRSRNVKSGDGLSLNRAGIRPQTQFNQLVSTGGRPNGSGYSQKDGLLLDVEK